MDWVPVQGPMLKIIIAMRVQLCKALSHRRAIYKCVQVCTKVNVSILICVNTCTFVCMCANMKIVRRLFEGYITTLHASLYFLRLWPSCTTYITPSMGHEWNSWSSFSKMIVSLFVLIQNIHKRKLLCSSCMQDMEKWFRRWEATHLLHDASLDSSVNEACLQRQCIMTWEKCGGSRIKHIIPHMLHLTTIPYSW